MHAHLALYFKSAGLEYLQDQEWMNLATGYKSTNICHHCMVTMHTYAKAPSPLGDIERRNTANFMTEAMKPGGSALDPIWAWGKGPLA